MGNTFSDLFYPGNPKRRRRAEQLNADLFDMKRQFDALYDEYKRNVLDMEPLMNKVLKGLGHLSVDELTETVRNKLTGDALKQWEDIQERMDKNNRIDGIISGIANLVGIGGLIAVGALAMTGVITIATGGAALAIFAGIVIIGALLAGVIEGAIIRDKLRDSIRNQFHQRREGKLALERMRVIVYWSSLLLALLSQVNVYTSAQQVLTQLVEMFGTTLAYPKKLYDEITMASVDKELLEYDISRGSFRAEDPSVSHTRSIAVSRNLEAPSSDLEGHATVSVKSIQGESSKTPKPFKDDRLTFELCKTTSERSALVWLQREDKYVCLNEEEDGISVRKVQKHRALYLLESNMVSLDGPVLSISLSASSEDLGTAGKFKVVVELEAIPAE